MLKGGCEADLQMSNGLQTSEVRRLDTFPHQTSDSSQRLSIGDCDFFKAVTPAQRSLAQILLTSDMYTRIGILITDRSLAVRRSVCSSI